MSEQDPRVETDRPAEPEPVQVSPDEAPQTADSVDSDVKSVVDNHTGDGPGEEDPGPSDFQGFAEPDVQDEDDEEGSQ